MHDFLAISISVSEKILA